MAYRKSRSTIESRKAAMRRIETTLEAAATMDMPQLCAEISKVLFFSVEPSRDDTPQKLLSKLAIYLARQLVD